MSWWNPFDNNTKCSNSLNIAIFNLLSEKNKVKVAEDILANVLKIIKEQTVAKQKILSEIKRLKEEKWDNDGFDRLYELVDVEIIEDPKVK